MAGAQLELPLTEEETTTLQHCESVIEAGRKVFLEVGEALVVIRDQRLYRNSHATFEAYCRERWDFGRSTAYQMIEAVAVAKNLAASEVAPEQMPENEAQMRQLAKLPAEEQGEAWKEAQATAPAGKVTAAHVAATVANRLPEPAPRKETPAETKPDMVSDFMGDAEEADKAPEPATSSIEAPNVALAETPDVTPEESSAPVGAMEAPAESAATGRMVQHSISGELDDALWEADLYPLEIAAREALRLKAILTKEAEGALAVLVANAAVETTPCAMLETVLSIYLQTKGLTVRE